MRYPLKTKRLSFLKAKSTQRRSIFFINLFLVILFSQPLLAQNILSEDFDSGTFPPTGWDNSTFFTPWGCSTWSYGCQWIDGTSSMGWPGPAAHSGNDMAFYNSNSMDFGSTAELATPSMDFSSYTGSGFNQVSFWMYRNDGGYGLDSVSVYVNTSATSSGGTWIGTVMREMSKPPAESAEGWYQYAFKIPASYSGTSNYIIFVAYADGWTFDMYLDDVSVDHVPPCSGTPNITSVSPARSITVCPGTYQHVAATVDLAADISFQWQRSDDGGTTWYDIINDTDLKETFFITKDAQFRMIETCNNSGMTDTSDVVTMNVSSNVTYASLPYFQDFESWSDRCDSKDVPDNSWTNDPSYGDQSWRRDDEGYSDGGWSSGWSSGDYAPVAESGKHSARFHNTGSNYKTAGKMYLYLDCSTSGNKELDFYYYNLEISDIDTLDVSMSTDEGLTFEHLKTVYPTNMWTYESLPVSSNSAHTIIRFTQTSNNGSYDMGLDNVQVLPQCSGKPVAGTLASKQVCANHIFYMMLSGTSPSADLKYEWQQSTDGTTWADVSAEDTLRQERAEILTATYFRCIVTCRSSGLSDTSNVAHYTLKPFYYCYCNPNGPGVQDYADDNIGNVTITAKPVDTTILNNGDATDILNNPDAIYGYSNYDTITPIPVMYQDSLYEAKVTEISQNDSWDYNSAPVNIYIDYNHDGVFNKDEKVFDQTTSGDVAAPSVLDTFRVPRNAQIGITGMRVILGVYMSSPLDPCNDGNTSINGEFEDYLVNIKYQPCSGPVNAGSVLVKDSGMCADYPFTLYDTTYGSKISGVQLQWQMSPDGISWGDVGPANVDTLVQTYHSKVFYRMQTTCSSTGAKNHSGVKMIHTNPSYACYCFSMATGGLDKDSSDADGVRFATFTSLAGGPHLLNPAAINGHADDTHDIIDLWTDSTYTFDLYYTLKSAEDMGARVTMFIDYNMNHTYDAPDERVWSKVTDGSTWYLTHDITIPSHLINGTPTGMRLIINNNKSANSPSDDGCGPYTSGETVDFVVRFNTAYPASVGIIKGIDDLDLYPNPTKGKFKVTLNATSLVNNMTITVTNMTGQQVLQRTFNNTQGQFSTNIDLSDQPRGLYFVEFMADGQRMIRKLVIE